MNVSEVLVLGGSICFVLRRSEGQKGSVSHGLSRAGGPTKEGLHVRGGISAGIIPGFDECMKTVALGGSI